MGNESSSPESAKEFIESTEHKLNEIRSSETSVSSTGIEEVVSQDDDMSGTSTSIIRDDENLSEISFQYLLNEKKRKRKNDNDNDNDDNSSETKPERKRRRC